MSELDIKMIFALSPQAKGRVERGFKTHQDRLVKELRLQKISTIAAANRFLWECYIRDHNARCAVRPANSTNAHRPILKSHNLDRILSVQTTRTLANDFTLRFQNQFFQILKEQNVRVRPGDTILIELRLDGSTRLRFKGRYLNYKRIPKQTYRPLRPIIHPTRLRPGTLGYTAKRVYVGSWVIPKIDRRASIPNTKQL
jgi:hypothetical protein